MDQVLKDFFDFYVHLWGLIWLWIITLIVVFLFITFKYFKENSFFVFFELFFEKIYEFFEEILGKEEKGWIKIYITLLFFIILFSNLLGVFLELLLPIFADVNSKESIGIFHDMVHIPTSDINFNVAMAMIGLVIILIEQFRTLGLWKALYEYFPILGKDYIPYTRGILPKVIDLPLFLLVKLFDIVISLFLWLLEIIWHGAKIISLSFRLFWNVTSWGILLAMLIGALLWFTDNMFGIDFPVLWPVILYLQSLLVALIQALVFPLLIAIFIKVAKVH